MKKKALYDVVLFGATGFVGQILIHYLNEHFGTDGKRLKWAVAGRSQARLREACNSLGSGAAALPLIVADASDETALRELCAQSRVVISTVGPYALYGEPLVRICAQSGTDYCDVTGEVQWIRRMIRRYEDDAQKSGARIVHCCGFDSIPSDMGVYLLQREARERFGQPATRVKMRVRSLRGSLSGGTIASVINVIKEASQDKDIQRELADPYSLCPAGHTFSVTQPVVRSAQYDEDFSRWVAPFMMAFINTAVVMRSNALAGAIYGHDFRYDEAMMTGRGVKGRLSAIGVAAGLRLFPLLAALRPSRWLLKKLVPKPGEGPSPEAQEKGGYDLRFLGKTAAGQTLQVRVTGDRDPGYGSTAKMLGQAAVCLAMDIDPSEYGGGFWTPSTLFGDKLLERLTQHAGMTFEVMMAGRFLTGRV